MLCRVSRLISKQKVHRNSEIERNQKFSLPVVVFPGLDKKFGIDTRKPTLKPKVKGRGKEI
jgi:hypothetical protein